MSKLLPPNATKLEKNIEQLGEKITALPVPFVDLHRIHLCPVAHLPWLAGSTVSSIGSLTGPNHKSVMQSQKVRLSMRNVAPDLPLKVYFQLSSHNSN